MVSIERPVFTYVFYNLIKELSGQGKHCENNFQFMIDVTVKVEQPWLCILF
jgi:hypothetical protein